MAEVKTAQQTEGPGMSPAEAARQGEDAGGTDAGNSPRQAERAGVGGATDAPPQTERAGTAGATDAPPQTERAGTAGATDASPQTERADTPGTTATEPARQGEDAGRTGTGGSPPQAERAGAPPPPATFLEAYGRMYLIRLFENAMHRLFLAGEVHGTTHLYAGQEAVAVGVCLALEAEDYVAGTYRGHGHALAKGTAPAPLIAEMLGRATGVCGGRAGSMNVVDLEHGLIGCYGIVGGSIAAATGAALSGKKQGRVAVAFFGDGAVNQAYFHECLNMARVFSLPAVFVCENNFYGEFTPMASVTAGSDIAARGRAYDVPSEVVDGNDLWAVHAAAARAAHRARAGGGPTLLECQTYRHYGHSKSDPAPYRPKDEVEEWLARDPLKIARTRLQQEGVTETQLAAAENSARTAIDQAVEEALSAPYPDPAATPATEFRP